MHRTTSTRKETDDRTDKTLDVYLVVNREYLSVRFFLGFRGKVHNKPEGLTKIRRSSIQYCVQVQYQYH